MKRLVLAAVLAALFAPPADAARYAVGVRSSADLPELLQALPGAESLAPLPAAVVERSRPPRVADLPGATYVERLGTRRLAFVPNDPLVPKQWHLTMTRAFDYWDAAPTLAPVRVAVIDSGVDGSHPELAGKIFKAESFVGGSARVDEQGHGTFVAGVIAAEVDNASGIAGMAPSAELLVAKVVDSDNLIDVEAEARAIRWAVQNGARVINLSIGGFRDPRDPSQDAYSPLEAEAIGWAHGRGAVVVAAVGNSLDVPPVPWPYASYPAALPHVLGVSAIARNGSVPPFSNRDKIFNDIAAPGEGIVSTFPFALTALSKDCAEQGYSTCGADDFRHGEGTSFAAPQVSAAAAVLLSLRPELRPEQVTALLTQSARDVNATNGCPACAFRRDKLSGRGRLDVMAAIRGLSGPIPPPDRLEPNDDAGPGAMRLWGQAIRLEATLDYWDDQNDVYAIRLRRNQPVYVSVRGPAGEDTNLLLWRPRTKHVDDLGSLGLLGRQSAHPGGREFLSFRAARAGLHYVQVKLASRGEGRYKLVIIKA